MTGPLVGITVLQPASGTIVLPGQSMTCSGRATGHGGLQTTLVDRVVLNLDRGSDIEAGQRASPTHSSAGSTSAGTAPTSSKTARDPPGSSCPWPLSSPAAPSSCRL